MKQNFFWITILIFLILSSAVSYYRFIVVDDYLVSYEAFCDSSIESCFIGCEDEECTAEYEYKIIERRATDINNLCGSDITDCEASNYCDSSPECTIIECSEAEGDECSSQINN